MQYTVSEPEKLLFRSGWGGWVGGEEENKAISAFSEVEVEVEAELGKNLGRVSVFFVSMWWC